MQTTRGILCSVFFNNFKNMLTFWAFPDKISYPLVLWTWSLSTSLKSYATLKSGPKPLIERGTGCYLLLQNLPGDSHGVNLTWMRYPPLFWLLHKTLASSDLLQRQKKLSKQPTNIWSYSHKWAEPPPNWTCIVFDNGNTRAKPTPTQESTNPPYTENQCQNLIAISSDQWATTSLQLSK